MTIKQAYGQISAKILELLQSNPNGLDIEEIRAQLGSEIGTQQHLDRRVRDLDPFYEINRVREGKRTVYILQGKREAGEWQYEKISKTLQAKLLHQSGGRCEQCGKTVKDDKVRLQIDHKIPQSWGGETTEENLWVLCSTCNEGKKNYFATFDAGLMKKVVNFKSVHQRIAELLHLKQGEWVDSDLIRFVACAISYQTDWPKRLRELRYFGLKIETRNKKLPKRVVSEYRLLNWIKLPKDPTAAARLYERKRAQRNHDDESG